MVRQTAQAVAYSTGQIVVAGLAAFVIGLASGCLSGILFNRWPDRSLWVLAELIRAFPAVLLLLLAAAFGLGGGWVLALYFAVPIWRVARAEFIEQAKKPYFLTALLRNRSRWKSFLIDLLPNVLPALLQYLPVVLADMLSVQVAIEFLGFGPPPPQASMGGLMLEAIQLGIAAPWVWLPTTFIMVALVVAGSLFSSRAARWT
jgi:peptide/nickel transport system permease protein